MTAYFLGLLLFFGVHSLSIVAPAWSDGVRHRLGEKAWKGLYSLVAALGLALLLWGYAQVRRQWPLLYLPPSWLHWASAALMLPVFPLLLGAYLPGRIKAATTHPMLWAVVLWSAAHLLSNGSVADLLLFGSFLLWGIFDLRSLLRRGQRPIRTAPLRRANDAAALILGLVIYLLLIGGAHRWLFGIAPLP